MFQWLINLFTIRRRVSAALIEAARVANIHINPKSIQHMRINVTTMLAIIAALSKSVVRAQQAVKDALDVVEPLRQKNEALKLSFQQLNTADKQLDEVLTSINEALPVEDRITLEEDPDAQPVEGNAPDGTDNGSATPTEDSSSEDASNTEAPVEEATVEDPTENLVGEEEPQDATPRSSKRKR